MNSILLIASLISPIIELMKIAETDYTSAGAGADKKVAVLSGVQAIVSDQTMWAKISGFISSVVDIIAKIHFGAKS